MSAPRWPAAAERLGLGVGVDMPWGSPLGFQAHRPPGEALPEALRCFFERYGPCFRYAFVAFQPRNRSRLRISAYVDAFDSYFGALPGCARRALHHTLLNTGTPDDYAKDEIIEFTNDLIARYGFLWIIEDIGIWSLRGRSMPYPLPPLLTREGLECCVAHVSAYQEALSVPLCIEFPGFTEGSCITIGDLHMFDYFREVAERTGSPVTLDTGHILSYQWLRGRRESGLYEELERLPLDRCFEIHLSGCAIEGDRFQDLHHGVLIDEQIELLERLLERCPRLSAVTYEDPRFTANGELVPAAVRNFDRLRDLVADWATTA